jgi:hypothetical protein
MKAGAMGVGDELPFQIVRLACDILLEVECVWSEKERIRPDFHALGLPLEEGISTL